MSDNTIHNKRLWVLPKGSRSPLYQQIQELIMEHIQSGRLKPGDLLPSYPWLSRTLSVADKTVRQAYAALHAVGVLDIKKGKGTFIAGDRSRSGTQNAGRAGAIGVLPPNLAFEQNAFFWRTMRSIQEHAFAEHLDILALSRSGDLRVPGQAERLADPRRLDGLIVLAEPVDEFLARVSSLKVPVVQADGFETAVSVDSVTFEHAGAARELAYRLIGQGHKKIGFVRTPRGQAAAQREIGFRHAMGAAELPIRPSWVVNVDVDLGETGMSALDALLGEGVTAVLAHDRTLAETVVRCAQRRGLSIPQDLSVAAIMAAGEGPIAGDLRLAGATFDPAELGRRLVKRVVELLSGVDPVPRREVIEAEKLDGDSVAPPKERSIKSLG